MTGPKTSASEGSTAIGGENSGTVTNVNVGDGSTVDLHINAEIARRLPSHLGALIAHIATSNGLAALSTQMRAIPPEVKEKLHHNHLPERHPIIRAWAMHSLALERAYNGLEQQNADGRYLVHQRAGAVYQEELLKKAQEFGIPEIGLVALARQHALALISAVTDRLIVDYCNSQANLVEAEVVHLAVSLVVADAVVECEVLEKPDNAFAS